MKIFLIYFIVIYAIPLSVASAQRNFNFSDYS